MARVLIAGDASSLAMRQWVSEMQARGHELLLVSPSEPTPGVQRVTVNSEDAATMPFVRFIARIRRIRRLARDFGATVYHGHYATDYAFWLAAAGAHPLLVTCWGSDVLLEQRMLTRLKRRIALRTADAVTATSGHALRRALEIGGAKKISEVVHWGVDCRVFHPGSPDPARPGFTVLSFRNLYPLYNVALVLEAFAEAGIPEAELRIAGDGPERSALEALASKLGIERSVVFLGRLTQSEIAEELRRADVCISVPSSDATAVSNLEAMASGVPLIASDLPSTREWVVPGETGLLVAIDSSEHIADALRQLSGDTETRHRMGTNALAIIRQRGDRAAQMDRASEIYELLELSS